MRKVLILVVVEDVLVLLGLEKMLKQDVVLILVVVEDVLVHLFKAKCLGEDGLNPCCGGRCSSTD